MNHTQRTTMAAMAQALKLLLDGDGRRKFSPHGRDAIRRRHRGGKFAHILEKPKWWEKWGKETHCAWWTRQKSAGKVVESQGKVDVGRSLGPRVRSVELKMFAGSRCLNLVANVQQCEMPQFNPIYAYLNVENPPESLDPGILGQIHGQCGHPTLELRRLKACFGELKHLQERIQCFFMDNLRQLTWVCGVYYIGIIWHDDKLLNLGGSLLSDEPTWVLVA